MNAIRNSILAIFLMAFSITKAQKSSQPDYNQYVYYLKSLSSYGDYNALDSLGRLEIETALDICTYLLKEEKDSICRSEIYSHRGRLYVKRRTIDSAKSDLENALYFDPSNVVALDRLSFITTFYLKGYSAQKKTFIHACVKACERICRTDSNNPQNWIRLSKAYAEQNNVIKESNRNKIMHCWQKCIELDSNEAEYYFELAQFHKGLRKEQLLRKALNKQEYWLYRSHLIALYAYEYKKYPEALKLIDESIALYEPMGSSQYFFMSDLYYFKAEVYKSMKNMKAYSECKKKVKYYNELDQ